METTDAYELLKEDVAGRTLEAQDILFDVMSGPQHTSYLYCFRFHAATFAC